MNEKCKIYSHKSVIGNTLSALRGGRENLKKIIIKYIILSDTDNSTFLCKENLESKESTLTSSLPAASPATFDNTAFVQSASSTINNLRRKKSLKHTPRSEDTATTRSQSLLLENKLQDATESNDAFISFYSKHPLGKQPLWSTKGNKDVFTNWWDKYFRGIVSSRASGKQKIIAFSKIIYRGKKLIHRYHGKFTRITKLGSSTQRASTSTKSEGSFCPGRVHWGAWRGKVWLAQCKLDTQGSSCTLKSHL